MSGDDEIIIRGGRAAGYTAEYEGKSVEIKGWRLLLQRLIAAWVYKKLGA